MPAATIGKNRVAEPVKESQRTRYSPFGLSADNDHDRHFGYAVEACLAGSSDIMTQCVTD